MLVKVIVYRDFWLRFGISILLALFFVFLGTDSIAEVVKGEHFFSDLMAGFALIFIISSYINLLTAYLDTQYPWNKYRVTRLLYQLIASVVLPSLFALAYMYIYLIIILELKKEEVVFFKTEFPIGVLFIIFWNLVYIGYYFSQENKKQKEESASSKEKLFTLQNIRTGMNLLPVLSEHSITNENPGTETRPDITASTHKIKVLMAVAGNKHIPITVDSIAWLWRTDTYTSLKTFHRETYLLDHSLDDLIRLLDENCFFRANQQFIINLKACHYYSNEENGELVVHLIPRHEEKVIVNPKRAQVFKEWMTR